MNYKLMKFATVIMLVAVAILGTAGVASAGVGNFSINLSNGEITSTDVNYTGYIVFTPDNNFNLSTHRPIISSDDQMVTFTGFGLNLGSFTKKENLFADYSKFSYQLENTRPINGFPSYAVLGYAGTASLTGGKGYNIVPFTIHVNPAIINETVNISFTNDNLGSYLYDADTSSRKNLGVDLFGIQYILNNATPNSVEVPNSLSVNIETNATVFDENVTVFSELAKEIANSSLGVYFLNYSSSNEDVIKFYNYSTTDSPRYVVLKGSNSSEITVNLTNVSDSKILDSKKFIVTTNKITLGVDAFNYTANHTYPYDGKSVASDVLTHVKNALLNHSVGAADVGEEAYENGYVRDIGSIELTFFNTSGMVEPIEGGLYTFNVTIRGNENYNTVENLTIANNSFTIGGVPIKGISLINRSQYNANPITGKAKQIIEFNATGQDFSSALFNETTIVGNFTYNFALIQLPYNDTNYTGNPSNFSISSDNTLITWISGTHPAQNVTQFIFEGCPRGDVDMSGVVDGADATKLSNWWVDPVGNPLNASQKFYANVQGSLDIGTNEIRLISQYSNGLITEDYTDW